MINKLQITIIKTIKNEDDLNLKTLNVHGIFTCSVHVIFGHIWTQNGVLELLGALEPPKSALRGPILLAHGNSGHKLPKIRRGRFLG